MLRKRDLSKLIKCLQEDKVLRTQTFLTTNKLTAGSVVEKDGGTLLHMVCKMGAENVFWAIRRSASSGVYMAKDTHGRTACHYAAIHLIKTNKISVFNNMVQPMIDACADCLHVRDKDGCSPLQILSRHRVAAELLRAQLGRAPPSACLSDSWGDKIWAEMQYENRAFDRHDQDLSGCVSDDAETADEWAERIGAEHAEKTRPQPRPRMPSDRRDQEREQRRREQQQREEQERQRRFQEGERRRQQEEEARRAAREEAAHRRLNETPKHAGGKLTRTLRQYRTLHKLVHGGDERLVPADFRPLAAVTIRDLRRLVQTGAENAVERRRAVRDLLRLWHPDKCMAKIERRLVGSVDTVKSTVVSFVQLLNQLL